MDRAQVTQVVTIGQPVVAIAIGLAALRIGAWRTARRRWFSSERASVSVVSVLVVAAGALLAFSNVLGLIQMALALDAPELQAGHRYLQVVVGPLTMLSIAWVVALALAITLDREGGVLRRLLLAVVAIPVATSAVASIGSFASLVVRGAGDVRTLWPPWPNIPIDEPAMARGALALRANWVVFVLILLVAAIAALDVTEVWRTLRRSRSVQALVVWVGALGLFFGGLQLALGTLVQAVLDVVPSPSAATSPQVAVLSIGGRAIILVVVAVAVSRVDRASVGRALDRPLDAWALGLIALGIWAVAWRSLDWIPTRAVLGGQAAVPLLVASGLIALESVVYLAWSRWRRRVEAEVGSQERAIAG